MPFPKKVREDALVACRRHCCVCDKLCGINIECHHIIPEAEGGPNDYDNCIPVCFDCHSNINHYNQEHPKGNSFSQSELKQLRTECYNKYTSNSDEIAKGVEELQMEVAGIKASIPPTGAASRFAFAAQEFQSRTCEIGFLDGSRYVSTGLCCFIDKDVAITSTSAIDLLTSVLTVRSGKPIIISQAGMATFEVLERCNDDIAILKSGAFDTSARDRIALERGWKNEVMGEIPLQTPVKARRYLYPGDEFAFLNSPRNSKVSRWTFETQVERGMVSFRQKTKPPTVSFFIATPTTSRIDHGGAPVFTEDAHFVGVIANTIKLEEEVLRRPVIASLLFVVEPLFKK